MAIVLEEKPEVQTKESFLGEERVDWSIAAIRAIRMLTQQRDTFTIDDVRAVLDLWHVPVPTNSAVLISVLKTAERNGLCRHTDDRVASKRPEARSRKVSVWRRMGGSIDMLSAVRAVCEGRSAFTIDHVRAMLETRGITTYARAAIESALGDAGSRGWCRKTRESVTSTRDGNQVVIWKSAAPPLPVWIP